MRIGMVLTNDGVLLANLHLGCAHVSNLDFAMCTIDKDVVTLDVAVNDGRVVRVEIDQALQDLPAPSLNNFDVGVL
jgi:hypothetical protein